MAREHIKMLRKTFITREAISKMPEPNIAVFGKIDGTNVEIYLYKDKNKSRWVSMMEIRGWGMVLEALNYLVKLGIPKTNFEFYGTIFESDNWLTSQFLTKTEEKKEEK